MHRRDNPLIYVGEGRMKRKVAVSFGLMTLGYFWIDDVRIYDRFVHR